MLILCDEVLNFCNRHRQLVDQFYAFLQNLTVAATGTTHGAAVISLPRSQVEMTDWDQQWQDRITKVVRCVAKDLIVTDEGEVSEVVRRRLFESLGPEKTRLKIAKLYADWCFERRAQLPPEWTAVDSATTESKARDFLQKRFEACYPFHPATLSVFQRKWQALPMYQQTRGTLAMLAQWVSWAFRAHHTEQVPELLLTLGSAPLHVAEFRSAILGQLGEPRLGAAIEADIAGQMSHSRALDADAKGALKDIHRRVAAAILFESSGGQTTKIAHLPDLRFALTCPSPKVDTTSIDSAAAALEARAFFIRKVSSDGYQIHHQATLKKVVSDRKASLDWDKDTKPLMRKVVREEFERGATIRMDLFPEDSTDIDNTPRLRVIVAAPEAEWSGSGPLRQQIAQWTRKRGEADRDYPAALVWCVKKAGKELQEKAELLLAWHQVQEDIRKGVLGSDYQPADLQSVAVKLKDAHENLLDDVWASYRYVVIADRREQDGLKVIDLGAGHAHNKETLCGRIVAALKTEGYLNESVGAGYLDRSWPEALKDSGAWPLASLRKCFLDGSFTRLLDPDAVLRSRIIEFVMKGEFGLASGATPDGTYDRLWFAEPVGPEEVSFEYNLFLLQRERAKALKAGLKPSVEPTPAAPQAEFQLQPEPAATIPPPAPGAVPTTATLKVSGTVPPESWNRFGSKLIPKIRAGQDVQVKVELSCRLDATTAATTESDIRQILEDLGLGGKVKVEKGT